MADNYDERRWDQDIASHFRYMGYASKCKTERCRALFMERAKEIEDRYPGHKRAFSMVVSLDSAASALSDKHETTGGA